MDQANETKMLKVFLGITCMLKTYHWKTDKYSRHVGSEKVLDELSELVDNFVETYQGRYGKIALDGFSIIVTQHSDKSIVTYLDSLGKYLRSFDDLLVDTDLLNIRDEMLGVVNRGLYLFTLV
jgi:hypothetical protein